MEWQVILALVMGIPLMLVTQVYLWYLVVSGVYVAIRDVRSKRAAREHPTKAQFVGTKR